MLAALRAELFKTVRRRMTYILLATGPLLVTAYYALLWIQIRHSPGRRHGYFHWLSLRSGMSFENAIPYGLQLDRIFVTLVCVVFAATMMANEYDWRTAELAFSRGVKRSHFLAAKATVALAFVVVAMAVAFAVGLAWSGWFSHLYDLPFGTLDGARLGTAFASLGRTTFVVVPFVALALLCATIWRSASVSAGAALGFFFFEGLFTGVMADAKGLLAHVPEFLLSGNALAIVRPNGPVRDSWLTGPFGIAIGTSDFPTARAVTLVIAWTVIFVVVAFWRFGRRDVAR
jgi:ABC-type transport system involved in multi-copper enzyme maturation permease subunit